MIHYVAQAIAKKLRKPGFSVLPHGQISKEPEVAEVDVGDLDGQRKRHYYYCTLTLETPYDQASGE